MFEPLLFRQDRIPLRVFLVVPFLLQIFAVVGLTGWLSWRNGQKAVNDVASQLRNEVSARIHEKLSAYVALPPLVNQITANAIVTGQLDLKNEDIRRRHFWKQVQTFPSISFHFFGATNGEFFTARRLPDGEVQVGIATPQTNQQIQYFVTNSEGDRVRLAESIPNRFIPKQRPWFQTAAAAGRPTWTEIYRHFVTKGLTVSATHPVYNHQGQLLGVISTDFVFLQVNKFLRKLKIGQTGQTFIMDRSGELVSTSTTDPVFEIHGDRTVRIAAMDSRNELIRKSSKHLLERFGNLAKIQEEVQLEFTMNGLKHFLQVSPLKDNYGIDWLIVVTIPEADFMERIERNSQSTIALCALALGISTLLGLYAARKITKPILNLSQAAATLAERQEGLTVPEEGTAELRVLARSFNAMSQQLQEAFAILQHTAYHDSLTDLPNRSAFMHCLESAIARRIEHHDYLFAVLFLDLDRFKFVNDSLGHLTGDRLLAAVARRLHRCLRSHDTISRFGGDEFVILLNDIPSHDFAEQIAERIKHELKHPFDLGGNEIYTSASIGIVYSRETNNCPQDLLRDADIALYQAKHAGKARAKVFDTAMHDRATELLQLEMDLRRGIEQQEFVLFYQPIVALSNLKIVGCEALVRWNHPTRGVLAPGHFLAVAEDTGAIVNLDWWVLQEACRQMRCWQNTLPQTHFQHISVNLSSKLFMQPGWMEHFDLVLSETGLERKFLKLELVETTLMDSTDTTRMYLEKLRDSNVEIDIDDFGTGYSSLSYLCRFPLDGMKIDRSFIASLERGNMEIVRAIIVLARNLGMRVVAEGVETAAQLDILQELGCDLAQGYFFSKPLPAEDIEFMGQWTNKQVPSRLLNTPTNAPKSQLG